MCLWRFLSLIDRFRSWRGSEDLELLYVDTIDYLSHDLQCLIFSETVEVDIGVEAHVVHERLQQALEIFSFICPVDEMCMNFMT